MKIISDWNRLEGATHLRDGVAQVQDFGVHLLDEGLQFIDGVEDLNTFGVGVEADLEGARHGGDPATELILGIGEALGHKVDWLIFLILVGLDGGGGGLEGTVLTFVAKRVQQFTVGGQETGSISFHLTTFLAQTEFHGKPVDLAMTAILIQIVRLVHMLLMAEQKKEIDLAA